MKKKNDLYSQESVRAALKHTEWFKVLAGCVEKAKVLIYLPTECTAKTDQPGHMPRLI